MLWFAGLAFSAWAGVIRTIATFARVGGRNLRNVIVAGSGRDAPDLAERGARRADLGYEVLAVLDPADADQPPVTQQITQLLEQARVDEVFIDNWFLGLGLKILLRTIPVVLTGRGAY